MSSTPTSPRTQMRERTAAGIQLMDHPKEWSWTQHLNIVEDSHTRQAVSCNQQFGSNARNKAVLIIISHDVLHGGHTMPNTLHVHNP